MNLEDLVLPVSAQVGAVPGHIMQFAINAAVRSFYTETKAWLYDATATVVAGSNEAVFEVPEDTILYAIREMHVGQEPVYDRGSVEYFQHLKFNGNTGMVPAVFRRVGAQILVAPAPADRVALTAKVVLVPTPTAVEIDDYTGLKYFDTLVKLAARELFRMPGKDWTSNVGAQDCDFAAKQGIYEAKQEAQDVQDTQRLTSNFGGDGYW